jgi:hypothetical protein
MSRKRMYLFEHAYRDYRSRLDWFGRKVKRICSTIWSWFWKGTGAKGIEVCLRIIIVLAVIGVAVLYYLYEKSQGRGFSLSMLITILVLIIFVSIILTSWKTPVHFTGRVVSGMSASGFLLVLAAVFLVPAVGIFSTYLLMLFLLTALSFLVFLPMRGIHGIWLLYRRITYRCPYDDCSYSGLPIHICPSCGHQYHDLKPGFYGIFFHKCHCQPGNRAVKLPTMDFLGRKKLERLCGHCKKPLIHSALGELAEQPIALVGGSGTGKTVFFRQAVRELQKDLKTLPGTKIRIGSPEQERELANDLYLLDKGQVPEKTDTGTVRAFGLEVRIPKRLRSLLYIFDSPGEHFQALEKFGHKHVMKHVTGIILLVDPFSLPMLSSHPNARQKGLKPSETPFQRIVEVLVAGINVTRSIQSSQQCPIPLAVVLNKIDALPTTDFPFLAALCHPQTHSPSHLHQYCRQALEKLGGQNGIQLLEQKFTDVKYFACSALGRTPQEEDSRPFQPRGVSQPFLWLLGIQPPYAKNLYN